MAGGRRQHAGQLLHHGVGELGIVGGVQEGEHGVLPHHQAEPVAEREEGVVRIGRPSGDPHHVHPRLAEPGPGSGSPPRRGQRRTTGSGGYQQPPRQNTGVPFTSSPKPPDAVSTSTVRKPTLPRSRRSRAEADLHRVERLGAVGVGPPPLDTLQRGRTGQTQVVALGHDGEATETPATSSVGTGSGGGRPVGGHGQPRETVPDGGPVRWRRHAVVTSRRPTTRRCRPGPGGPGRHGPTGAGVTAQPGWRPSRVVRIHRRF